MLQAERPVPAEDLDTRPYWEAARRHRLELPRCEDCGRFFFPPRPRCSACLSTNVVWTGLSGRGTVYSFCIVCVPIVRGIEPPYVVAQIELVEQQGLRLVANVVDCHPNDVRAGIPVEVTFEDLGDDCSLPQFRPSGASTDAL